MLKSCRRCGKEKDITTCFYSHPQAKDGYVNICVECQKKDKQQYRSKTREKARLKTAKWRKANPERARQTEALWRINNPIKRLLQTARQRARAKHIPFDLVADDLQIPIFCPVLGMRLETGSGYQVDSSPSIDQIQPGAGYTKTNTQIISWRANKLKNNATIDELDAIVRYMRQHEDCQ